MAACQSQIGSFIAGRLSPIQTASYPPSTAHGAHQHCRTYPSRTGIHTQTTGTLAGAVSRISALYPVTQTELHRSDCLIRLFVTRSVPSPRPQAPCASAISGASQSQKSLRQVRAERHATTMPSASKPSAALPPSCPADYAADYAQDAVQKRTLGFGKTD